MNMISPCMENLDEGVAFAAAFLTALKRQKPTDENENVESAPKEYNLHLPGNQQHERFHDITTLAHAIRTPAPTSNVGSGSMDHAAMHRSLHYQQRDVFARDQQQHNNILRVPPHHALHASSTNAASFAPIKNYLVYQGGTLPTNINMAPNKHHHGRQEMIPSNSITHPNSISNTNSNDNDNIHSNDMGCAHSQSSSGKAHVADPSDSTIITSGFDVPRFVNGRELQLRDLLTQQDRNLTTQFTINIIDQLDFVYFEEGDRRSHRTHLPIGFRGIKCRYCHAPAGKSGRFFPSSLKTLSDTNKTLYTLHRHLIKCRMTPYNAKKNLDTLRQSHVQERKAINTHGSQRTFFRRIWGLLCPKGIGNNFNQKFTEETKGKQGGRQQPCE